LEFIRILFCLLSGLLPVEESVVITVVGRCRRTLSCYGECNCLAGSDGPVNGNTLEGLAGTGELEAVTCELLYRSRRVEADPQVVQRLCKACCLVALVGHDDLELEASCCLGEALDLSVEVSNFLSA